MKRIFVPTQGPDDWRRLLADPDKQWRDGYSAKELARRWEAADGLPLEIQALFSSSGLAAFQTVTFLAAFPEWQTELEGRGEPSHSDVLALAAAGDGLVTVAVEGKVGEPFGDTVADWRRKSAPGREQNRLDRLAFLQRTIGLTGASVDNIRYQLLHRTAAAVIEARRFHARYAAMIVHSFAKSSASGAPADSFSDYRDFLQLYGVKAEPGQLLMLCEIDGVRLLGGWASATVMGRS